MQRTRLSGRLRLLAVLVALPVATLTFSPISASAETGAKMTVKFAPEYARSTATTSGATTT
jgi:hypothetical protein